MAAEPSKDSSPRPAVESGGGPASEPGAQPGAERAVGPAPEPAVEARRLRKVFRAFWRRRRVHAVMDLDLSIQTREVFGLLGPNGSGKSTTMKLILGLLNPTGGTVRVLGGSPRDVGLKSRIGYLPEESPFHPHLTARETLVFYGDLFSIPRRSLRARVDDLLELVGLERDQDRRVGEFSRGMLRRIGLAQALVNDPDLLILDEPTAGLDPLGTREVKDLVLGLRRRGKTVVLSSHLLADVEDVCDRIAILHQGRLQALGPVSVLLQDDRRTQITTGQLSTATVDALVVWLREREGPGLDIQVGRPSTRLEEFFLRIVEPERPKAGGDEPRSPSGDP